MRFRMLPFLAVLFAGMAASAVPSLVPPLRAAELITAGGIRFQCAPSLLAQAAQEMDAFLAELAIPADLLSKSSSASGTQLSYRLRTPEHDTSTLDLVDRPEYALAREAISLPAVRGMRVVHTVSRKEILLTLLQHGRLTEMTGDSCSVAALREMIGIRQNVVAWAEHLEWIWPNGGPARWNTKYWKEGTPVSTQPLADAFLDMFLQQKRYTIGCYTATKVVYVHALLDYHRRVNPDAQKLRLLESRLLADGEPLVDVEPAGMWSFEEDFDPAGLSRPGKLLRLHADVAMRNFVPGDWVYLLNTDPVSRRKTGYEGSNAIYLGGGRFDDYYNDHQHAYAYEEKLDEVYQWRHGVFNRRRDAQKRQVLSAPAMARLSESPARGGLVFGFRVVPGDVDLTLPGSTRLPQQLAIGDREN
ncbi:hypothetical protein [Rhodocyclus tenuis]|uniref:hypothetical protein n=1 Tax=Rhodocyclus tenuis TaxID=1066 RepID=UPI001907B33F|nr:hypothetical protein [Rhodocyclus tenuis]